LLPEGCIYPREQRGARDLLRRRFSLVRQAVRLMLSIQSSFNRSNGKQLSANKLRQLTPSQLVDLFPDLHPLARACYHMLHEGTTFDLTRAFG
jgi:transposase